MMNITEDYVSFETAKLLKEKGFGEDIDLWYDENGEMFFRHKYDISNDWRVKAQQKVYQCPTLQMVMKWLREVHNLSIEPYRTACGYLYIISTIPYGSCKCNPKEGGDEEDSGQWTTYKGACEAAIKYCLENLI